MQAGQILGHYRVMERLGAGGMGEVYLAEDTRLGRKVALKVLPAEVSRDSRRLHRFEQEARTASALNHPHILTVYEIAEFDSQRVLVTEFVDGEILRYRIARKLKLGETLEVLEQVLAALAAAHEVGVIHRDIKPENIMIRRDGIVKVVDFGLAKLIQPDAEPASSTTDTTPGLVMGTTPYMSPEQLSGDPVDARTDLWSIGVMLYEMVAQRRPFEGRTTTEITSLILQRDPRPLSAAATEVPHELERIVRKALQKKPDQRYQTAKDLLIDLRELRRASETSATRLRLPRVAVSPLRRGALVAMAALAITAGVLLFQVRRAPALTTKDMIVLADFENQTGDPVFDGTLKQALAVQLGQSPYLNIFPEERVRQTLQTMGRAPSERVTPAVAREICERQGVKAMLTGSIARMGSNYVIALEAVNGRTGDSLARELVEAPRKEEVIRALGEGASKLRKELGESLSSIEKFDVPIEQATTSSLGALRAFTQGNEHYYAGKSQEAILFFQRAIELDPKFAFAHARLGAMYYNTYRFGLAAESSTAAFRLRDRATEREKFFISQQYLFDVTGQLDKSIEVLELWKQTYPRDFLPYGSLAHKYWIAGQYEKVVENARQALSLNPNLASAYLQLAVAYLYLERFEKSRTVFREAFTRKIDMPQYHPWLYYLAALEGDSSLLQQQLEWANANVFGDQVWGMASLVAGSSGRLREAETFTKRAVAVSQRRSNAEESTSGVIADYAMVNAVVGRCDAAKEEAARASAMTSGEGSLFRAGVAVALCGATAKAESIAAELSRQKPQATVVQSIYVPMIRAAVALTKHESARALDTLEATAPYERGHSAPMFPAYLRALAHLQQGAAAEAAAEFQKLVEGRVNSGGYALYPLAHLGLARTANLAGDTTTARKRYEEFFALWKDADSDLPILLQAREEYRKLTSVTGSSRE